MVKKTNSRGRKKYVCLYFSILYKKNKKNSLHVENDVQSHTYPTRLKQVRVIDLRLGIGRWRVGNPPARFAVTCSRSRTPDSQDLAMPVGDPRPLPPGPTETDRSYAKRIHRFPAISTMPLLWSMNAGRELFGPIDYQFYKRLPRTLLLDSGDCLSRVCHHLILTHSHTHTYMHEKKYF